MSAIILTSDQFDELVNKIDLLNLKLEETSKAPEPTFLDNQEFIQLMHISKRTAQTWRDNEIINYSQIGSKIYYHKKDVDLLLEKNYSKASNSK